MWIQHRFSGKLVLDISWSRNCPNCMIILLTRPGIILVLDISWSRNCPNCRIILLTRPGIILVLDISWSRNCPNCRIILLAELSKTGSNWAPALISKHWIQFQVKPTNYDHKDLDSCKNQASTIDTAVPFQNVRDYEKLLNLYRSGPILVAYWDWLDFYVSSKVQYLKSDLRLTRLFCNDRLKDESRRLWISHMNYWDRLTDDSRRLWISHMNYWDR